MTDRINNRTASICMTALLAALVALSALSPIPARAEEEEHDDHAEHSAAVEMSAAEQAEFGIAVAEAGPAEIATMITLSGEIRPNDDRLAHLVPRYEGIVTEVSAKVGDQVVKGQVLAVIESNETLAPYPLRTMIDGTVIAKHITLGESASPDRFTFEVADLSTVWADLGVYQRDLDRIRVGQPVRVETGVDGQVAEGVITYVTPVVEESTRTATARVVLDNADGGWRPGIFVVAHVKVSSRDVAVAVPRTALLELHGEQVVFVRDEHGFEARHVVIGSGNDSTVEILSGLLPGEQYAAAGSFTLKAELEKSTFGDGHAH